MAKDDYNVLVYKILLYAYAVFKRKIVFDEKEFELSIIKGGIDKDYLINILVLMQNDGLISGLKFRKVWGGQMLLINDFSEMKITSNGINYLTDNSKMQQVKEFILESIDIFAPLIKLVLPM